MRIEDYGSYYTLRAPEGLIYSTEAHAATMPKPEQLRVVERIRSNLELLAAPEPDSPLA